MLAVFMVVTSLIFTPVNSLQKNLPISDLTKSALQAVGENYGILTVNEEKIDFILYTRKFPNGYKLIRNNIKNLRRSGFENKYPTKVLIHGYINNQISEAVQLPKNAYLSKYKYNILVVDWSKYAFPYLVAVNHVRTVGHILGLMILYLNKEGGLKLSKLHIIGHSLGSHIAGFVVEKTKIKPARITGLDPAAPMFEGEHPSKRLDSEDAHFVDIIHTSVSMLGLIPNIGHVDFYPNGGRNQPICNSSIVEEVIGACDHSASYIYFTHSIIKKNLYLAVKCNSFSAALEKQCHGSKKAVMGEYAFLGNPRGVYYVDVLEDYFLNFSSNDESQNFLEENFFPKSDGILKTISKLTSIFT